MNGDFELFTDDEVDDMVTKLEAQSRALWDERQLLKARQVALQPALEAAQQEQARRRAGKADPALMQTVGRDVTPKEAKGKRG